MCRGDSMYRSMKIRSSPNEEAASRDETSKPARASASSQAMRIPFPPPPAEALIMTGKPTLVATSAAWNE